VEQSNLSAMTNWPQDYLGSDGGGRKTPGCLRFNGSQGSKVKA